MENICGIYKITNPKKRVYIGQSIDCIKRFNTYKRVGAGVVNQVKLYNSLKKYGVENHKFEIICQCSREDLNRLEKYYVDLYQTFNSKFGLNLKDGGGSRVKVSDETKIKMSASRKGIVYSEETKRRMSEGTKGCTHSIETRKKMSESRLKMSDETKNKISENSAKFWLGKSLPAEVKEKISKSLTGKKHSKETKLKMIKSRTGLKRSEEQKKRMSDAQKLRFKKETT